MPPLLEMGLKNAAMATVLALIAASVALLCRRPALTHSLWLLVLLKLLTPPIVEIPLPWSIHWTKSEAPDTSSTCPTSAEMIADDLVLMLPTTVEEADLIGNDQGNVEQVRGSEATAAEAGELGSWKDMALPLWLTGSVLWFAWIGMHTYRFERLLRLARPASAELQDQVDDLAQRLGLSFYPTLWLVPGAISPMIWPIGRAPRLVFPLALLRRLDHEQRAALLVHELAHLRRRDHWVRFVELVVMGLYWWHPVVWWARREIHEAEEQCCDAWVVGTLAGAGRSYALALLQTVAFFSHSRSTLPAAASGIGQVPHLRRRLTMIMQGRTPRSLSWAGCCAVFCLGLLMLPLPPGHAQPPADKQAKSGAKDPREEAIAALKKALKELQDQKQSGQPVEVKVWVVDEKDKQIGAGGGQKADAEDVKKLHAEADQLAKLVEIKRRELQEVMARHRAARARLAKLQGVDMIELNVEGIHLPANVISVAPGQQVIEVLQNKLKEAPKDKAVLQLHKVLELKDGAKADPAAEKAKIRFHVIGEEKTTAPHKAKDSKAADVEKKLDRLLREVDELRRELRRDNAPVPPPPPGGGADLPPTAPLPPAAPTP